MEVMLLKMIVLPMLLKMLDATRKPLLVASFYAAILLTNNLIFDLVSSTWQAVALKLVGAWVLSAVVFYALHIFDSTSLYWPTLIGGFLALLVFF